MGLFIHYNLGLGGITHENFVKRLLKKFGKEDQLNHFIKISIENDSEELKAQIIEFINI